MYQFIDRQRLVIICVDMLYDTLHRGFGIFFIGLGGQHRKRMMGSSIGIAQHDN